MNTNKTDLNSILAGLRLEPCNDLERCKELLKDLQPINVNAIFQKMHKEHPYIFENTGSVTANSLARQEYNRQRPYMLLRNILNM